MTVTEAEKQGNFLDDKKNLEIAIEKARMPITRWVYFVTMFTFPVIIAGISLYKAYTNQPKGEIPTVDYVEKAIPVFLLMIVVEFLFDYKGKTQRYRLNDSMNSLFQGTLQVYFSLFIKWLRFFPYVYIWENYSVYQFPNHIISWILCFFSIDFGYYWFHRYAHEINALWAVHIAHHSSQEYNLTTALRQAAIQPLFSWIFYLSTAFFFSPEMYIINEQINVIYQFWIHTRFVGKLPAPIEYIFNTPSHHRVHHGRNPKYIDKNYAGTLIIFDRMFGTFQAEEEEVVYGVTHQLDTWNPYYVQFIHIFETAAAASKVQGLWNKWKTFWFYGPEFNAYILFPKEMANHPIVSPEYDVKYDSNAPNLVITTYLFLHSLVVLASVLIFGPIVQSAPFTIASFLCTGHTVLAIFSISAMFDQKSWAKAMEIFRVMSIPITYAYLQLWNQKNLLEITTADLQASLQSNVFVSLAGLALLCSLVTIIKYQPQSTHQVWLYKQAHKKQQ